MAEHLSTGRTLAVLQALASSPEPLAAGHLARQLGIPRSSLYRALETMRERGFVLHVAETNRWALGVAAYEVAWGYRRQNPLQRMAKPLVARLVDATGHSGHVTVLQGRDVIYVIEERAPHQPSLVTDVGVRLPAELTASGLAMLAAMSTGNLRTLYPNDAALTQRDGRGPTTRAQLRAELAATRKRGYAVEEHLVTAGFASVAMPVVDRAGHPVAAVALTWRMGNGECHSYGETEAGRVDRDALVEAVRGCVSKLQARLGGPEGTGSGFQH